MAAPLTPSLVPPVAFGGIELLVVTSLFHGCCRRDRVKRERLDFWPRINKLQIFVRPSNAPRFSSVPALPLVCTWSAATILKVLLLIHKRDVCLLPAATESKSVGKVRPHGSLGMFLEMLLSFHSGSAAFRTVTVWLLPPCLQPH